jgi:hypothetical protein
MQLRGAASQEGRRLDDCEGVRRWRALDGARRWLGAILRSALVLAVVGAGAWVTASSVAAASEHGQAKQDQASSEGDGHENAPRTRAQVDAGGDGHGQAKQTRDHGDAQGDDHGKGGKAHGHGAAAGGQTESEKHPTPTQLIAVATSIAPAAVASPPAPAVVVAPAVAAPAVATSPSATRAITAAASGPTTAPVRSLPRGGSTGNTTGPGPKPKQNTGPSQPFIRPPPLLLPSELPPSPTSLLTAQFPLIAVLFAAAAAALAGALALVVRLAVRR